MNFIFGTAGFAKEVDWLAEDIYASGGGDYRADFFVAEEGNELINDSINSRKVISESEFFEMPKRNEKVNCFIGVGKPEIKERIVLKIQAHGLPCNFPNLIHPEVVYDKRFSKIRIGIGNMICPKSVLTTDISLGNFVLINLGCTIGHDSVLGDYSTFSPGVHVSGNVKIAEKVFFGTGAVVLEKIDICANAIIGAGAVVNKNILSPGTYVGVPAKRK